MIKKLKLYWDSGIFISYFKGENRSEVGVTDAIKYYFRQIEKGEILMATSAQTIAEVLEHKMGEKQYKNFEDFLESDNVDVIDPNRVIFKVANEIRDFYGQQNPKYYIETADAVHLSTAIYYNAGEFHTLDSKDDKKKGTKGLLTLNPLMPQKYNLKICLPTMRFLGSTEHLFNL
jgi:predicted nucleic acid-binding protein